MFSIFTESAQHTKHAKMSHSLCELVSSNSDSKATLLLENVRQSRRVVELDIARNIKETSRMKFANYSQPCFTREK